MSTPEAALEEFAEHFDLLLSDLSGPKRKAIARKIGQRLRRANTKRIRRNVQPDGSKMAERKDRQHRGRMFKRLRLARQYRIDARPDGVELGFRSSGAEQVARVHHFGLVDRIGKDRKGRSIRARFEARQLLGFSSDDIDEITDELIEWLSPE